MWLEIFTIIGVSAATSVAIIAIAITVAIAIIVGAELISLILDD